MRYARLLFLPAVSYITRQYLDVTTITAISAIEIGKGPFEYDPLLVGSLSPHLQQCCSNQVKNPTSGVVLQLPNYVPLRITL